MQQKIHDNPLVKETQIHMNKTMHLVHRTLYKTIEFQILFKIFYLSILIFVINFLIGIITDIIDIFITTIRLDEAVNSIPIMSVFDFHAISILSVILFIFIYVYLVEKNGVIIITTEYYRNNFVSFFHTLFLSMRKTPLFIARRIYEMRIVALIFLGLYLMWKLLDFIEVYDWLVSAFGWILIFYGAWIFFSVLFKYTFTAYTTCLHPNESYKDFNNSLPAKFLRKRTHVTIVFYTIFIFVAFTLIILFSLIAKTMFYFSGQYPEMISTLFAFFISFTIVTILVVLSFLKTFKVAIMTILYYEERRKQNLPLQILKNKKRPFLSKKISYAIITLLTIITLAGAALTTTIKYKTDILINNAYEYIEQVKQNNSFTSPEDIEQFKNMKPQEFVMTILEHETHSSTLDTIEKFVFTFVAYLMIK